MTALPTTIGSIVTFDTWADIAETETFRCVATLIPGSIENGEARNVVWADSFTDGESDIFSTELILAGNPAVVFEAAANPTFEPLGGDVEVLAGETVTYLDPEDPSEDPMRLTVTYAPGFITGDGEFGEFHWVNSYGGYARFEDIEKGNPQVIVKGSRDL